MKILAALFISILVISCSSTKNLSTTPIGLINNVSYTDAKFDNPNASNGFLVKHDKKTYAITAKHILMIAKSDKMKFVDFAGELKEWKMYPKNDSTSYVVLDELLNPNQKDSLTWSYMDTNWDTYNDWLVFSIKENNTKHKPLKFRKTPLMKGEKVYAVGWSYGDKTGAQRVYEYTFDEIEGNYLNLIQVKGPPSMGGLSGAPIVDEKGQLVGLVSSGWEDEETKKVFMQATRMVNTIRFIEGMN